MKIDGIIIYITLMSLFIIFAFVCLHEATHYTIYKYGCSDTANITFGFSCTNNVMCGPATFIDDSSSCETWVGPAQAEMEIIGYNIMPGIEVLILISNIIFSILIDIAYKKKKDVKVIWRK